MRVSLAEGSTAIIPSGPSSDPQRGHLFVFVTGAFEDENGVPSVALVPLSSRKDYMLGDPTVVLRAGDHPFITKETWVCYRKAAVMAAEGLAKDIESGKIILKEPMKEEVLQRVKQGVCRSPYTPRRVRAFYQFAF
jgi:hypothetical protein